MVELAVTQNQSGRRIKNTKHRRHTEKTPDERRQLRKTTKTPRVGLARARNRSFATASEEVLWKLCNSTAGKGFFCMYCLRLATQ